MYFQATWQSVLCCHQLSITASWRFFFLTSFSLLRFVKFSMPNIPDFETLFSQVQLFISTCNGEHIRYATDTCKSRLTKPFNLQQLTDFFYVVHLIRAKMRRSKGHSLLPVTKCKLFLKGNFTALSNQQCLV